MKIHFSQYEHFFPVLYLRWDLKGIYSLYPCLTSFHPSTNPGIRNLHLLATSMVDFVTVLLELLWLQWHAGSCILAFSVASRPNDTFLCNELCLLFSDSEPNPNLYRVCFRPPKVAVCVNSALCFEGKQNRIAQSTWSLQTLVFWIYCCLNTTVSFISLVEL